jgi:sterol 3beta-glucosyltransferase
VNLLILTLDTRGDVQPLVALPRGLANAGHEAVLAAPHRFEGFVRDQGVPFAGIDDCWSVAAEGPGAGTDILVDNGQVVVGQHVAEKLGIPAVLALPIPMDVPTREVPWAGRAIPRWWPPGR